MPLQLFQSWGYNKSVQLSIRANWGGNVCEMLPELDQVFMKYGADMNLVYVTFVVML